MVPTIVVSLKNSSRLLTGVFERDGGRTKTADVGLVLADLPTPA
jgi:hypothetical protein